LCLAMLSTAAVLAVQLLDSTRLRPRGDVIPAILYIVFFAVVFTSLAVARTGEVDGHRASFISDAKAASSTLNGAEKYVIYPTPPSSFKTFELETNIRSSERSLNSDTATSAKDNGFSGVMLATILFSVLFLGFAIRVWRNL